MIRPSTKQAPAILMLLTAVFLVVSLATVKTAAAEPKVEAKRAEAQDVLAQIQEIDGELGLAIEAYNNANVKLAAIKADQQANARYLVIARSSLKNAQAHLSKRLVSLYTTGGEGGALEVMLGSDSLDDLLNRLEAVERVSSQDTRVLGEVKRFRAEVQKRKVELKKARTAQARFVADRAARKAAIEGQLAQRQEMLASIKDQIASLEAAEQQRQARLAAEVRARVAAATSARRTAAQPASAPAALIEANSVEDVLVPAPAADSRYGAVVGIAMQYLGVPYRWGGADPSSGFDCSGFSMYVYAKVGVSLPHHAATQYGMGTAVSRSDLQPGDLVFFHGLGHMGIYVGGGNFIHAPRTGDVVKISSMTDAWYSARFVGARRIG